MGDMIKCYICGEEFHLIGWKHLLKHDTTVAEYKNQYPNAPTISPSALIKKRESATRANKDRIGVPRSVETKNKISKIKRANNNIAWNKDVPMSNEQKKKLSETKRKRFATGETIHWNTGNTTPYVVKQKISNSLKSQNLTFSNESSEKRKKTCIEKYGVEYAIQSIEIQDRIKKTNIDKYGSPYPGCAPSIKEKIKQTCIEKYGVDASFASTEIQSKIKQTVLTKYGVEHIAQRDMPEHTLTHLNDAEWLYDQHVIQKKLILQIAKELQVTNTTVSRYLRKHNIETQTFFQSIGEIEVNEFIQSLNIKTVSNTRNIIPPYELDIYIPSNNIAIEYCGLYWHSEQAGKHKKYHANKYTLCKNRGIQLITIFEDEWLTKQNHVIAKLKSLLNVDDRPVIFARKTNINIISKISKKIFYDTNHIQGNGASSIDIGLSYDNILIACMSFIRKSGDIYELTRYATSARVVGGFSKLLKYFEKCYLPKKIISFADLRWSTGNLYHQTGWKIDNINDPDYSYSPNGIDRYHKFHYRRKNLPKLLKSFQPELSERVNCDNNDILRIWDCGKIRFCITYE